MTEVILLGKLSGFTLFTRSISVIMKTFSFLKIKSRELLIYLVRKKGKHHLVVLQHITQNSRGGNFIMLIKISEWTLNFHIDDIKN